MFHKLWNFTPSFLLSRFTATKPSGGNITVRLLQTSPKFSQTFIKCLHQWFHVHGWCSWLNLLSVCFQANSSLKLRKQILFSVSAIRQPSTLAAVEKNACQRRTHHTPKFVAFFGISWFQELCFFPSWSFFSSKSSHAEFISGFILLFQHPLYKFFQYAYFFTAYFTQFTPNDG